MDFSQILSRKAIYFFVLFTVIIVVWINTVYLNNLVQDFLFTTSSSFQFKKSTNLNNLVSSDKETPIKIIIWRNNNKNLFTPLIAKANRKPCFEGCTIKLSSAQEDADEADAIIIMFYLLTSGFKKGELPRRKSPEQIWIYRQLEPPIVYIPGKHLNKIFNWTMGYRRNSDIYEPYSIAIAKDAVSPSDRIIMPGNTTLEEWNERKSGVAVAVISNCKVAPSNRLQILRKLNTSGLPVDLFGPCEGGRNATCGRRDMKCSDNFWEEIASKYKFFLAFENSLCVDYITEKFWRTLQIGMVPVVLGRGDYLEVAPPHSFIDIRDFSGPEELVNFLMKLDMNDAEYAKYFEWRRYAYIPYKYGKLSTDLCRPCQKLKERRKLIKEWNVKNESAYSKIYSNIVEWWTTTPKGVDGGSACLSPEKMGLKNFL